MSASTLRARAAASHDEAVWSAVSSLHAAESEHEAWLGAVRRCGEIMGADAGTAFELTSATWVTGRASWSLPIRIGESFPIAPDSQAAFVAGCPTPVVSDDLTTEQRFVPGALLTRNGLVSSLSCRIDLPDGAVGLIGVHWRSVGSASRADVGLFQRFVSIACAVIADRRRLAEFRSKSHHDSLTGLLGRGTLLSELDHRLAMSMPTTVLLLDLDGFKWVNDTHGHRIGDEVLRQVGFRLANLSTVDQLVGRLGGDEFVVVTRDRSAADASALGDRLLGSIEEIIRVEHHTVGLSASIGVACATVGDDVSTLIGRADEAMYRAKADGRGCLRFAVAPVAGADVARHRAAAPSSGQVDLALVDDAIAGLRIVVQQIVDARTGRVRAVEALTRGPAGHRLEFPNELFAHATVYGRLAELELAAKQRTFQLALPDEIELFVNLEPVLISDPDFLDRLHRSWATFAPDAPVVAEITERAVLASPGRLLSAVESCRALGWKIALDDIGSRTQTLTALRWVRPDVVKLDTNLLQGANQTHAAHVAAVVAAYRDDSDVRVIAEGVECRRHVEIARTFGADLLQGYFFGRPAPLDQIDLASTPDRPSGDDAGDDAHDDDDPAGDPSRRIATKRDLLGLTRHIESVATTSDTLVLAALQRSEFLTPLTRRQYAAMARRCGFVGVLGQGLSETGVHIPGARIADLDPHDPLTRSWQVVALSPTRSVALVADEIDTPNATCDDMERRFTFRLLTNGHEVEETAKRLLRYF